MCFLSWFLDPSLTLCVKVRVKMIWRCLYVCVCSGIENMINIINKQCFRIHLKWRQVPAKGRGSLTEALQMVLRIITTIKRIFLGSI